jgi:uncharacterized membrane protein YphA (DoxX/SURF4 family)
MTVPNEILLVYLFAGVVLLVLLSVLLSAPRSGAPDGPSRAGRFFLVFLRLAIGWHVLVEGLDKVQSSTWSSEAYLREASGPLAPWFRELAGDTVRDRLTPGPDNTFPPALDLDWQNYFDRFVHHYQLDDQQRARAQAILDQSKAKTLHWMTSEATETTKPSPSGAALKRMQTVPERLKEYDALLQDLRRIEESELPRFGPGSHKHYLEAKADVNRVRNDLKRDLAGQTGEMRKALREVLTPAQKQMPPVPDARPYPWRSSGLLPWADEIVRWGLVVSGVCLLLGLFTRTACVTAAVLLLLFYLCMVPLPNWPENPKAEGHYILINKNTIEMLALLALAALPTGRWAGLDGLFALFRRRPAAETARPLSPSNPPAGTGTPPASPLTKESAHGP